MEFVGGIDAKPTNLIGIIGERISERRGMYFADTYV